MIYLSSWFASFNCTKERTFFFLFRSLQFSLVDTKIAHCAQDSSHSFDSQSISRINTIQSFSRILHFRIYVIGFTHLFHLDSDRINFHTHTHTHPDAQAHTHSQASSNTHSMYTEARRKRNRNEISADWRAWNVFFFFLSRMPYKIVTISSNGCSYSSMVEIGKWIHLETGKTRAQRSHSFNWMHENSFNLFNCVCSSKAK